MKLLLAFICALGSSGGAMAAGLVDAVELIDARDPQLLAEMVRAHGYRAETGVDAAGDPMIVIGVEGIESSIYLFGCTDGGSCDDALFRVGFDLPDGTTLEAMNDWNREALVGKAFLDVEGDPYLEQFVTLEGGVGPSNFGAALRWWGVAVRDFRVHIGF